MLKQNIRQVFFFVLLAAALIVLFLVFYPFLGPLALGLTLAIIFRPVYNKILRLTRRNWLSALLSIALIILVIVLPLTFIGSQLLAEIKQIYADYEAGTFGTAGGVDLLSQASALTARYLPWLSIDFTAIRDQVITWLVGNFSSIFSGLVRVTFGSFVMLIALFYFLKDGHAFRKKIHELSPLDNSEDTQIINRVERTVTSVIRGSIFIAMIQGLLVGTGFGIFGVPQPLLWGSAASVAALIPGLGTALVLIPGILYLFFASQYLSALGLFLWGALLVGLIDNFLGPVMVGQGAKIHPMFIFLSVIGGLSFFGPLGFVLGPIILAVVYSLLEIYPALVGKQE